MTAAGHKKFLFDTDFGPDVDITRPSKTHVPVEPEMAVVEVEVPEEIAPTFSEEDLARAREDGFKAGHAEATQDLATAIEQRIVNTLDAINAQAANLFDVFARDKEEHSRDAVAVATVIVRKLFPALNMDKAVAEIEHMIVEAMKRTSGAPTLIIRVSQDMLETIETKANALAALRGREGTVSVMADAKMAAGDASVEWDGGGMVRDTSLIWGEIDKIIERNLGEMRTDGRTDDLTGGLADASQEVVDDTPVKDNGEFEAESLSERPDALSDGSLNALASEETPPGADMPLEGAPLDDIDSPPMGNDDTNRVDEETPEEPETGG